MKRIPATAFFSITTPPAGERKVSVRFASPPAARALICSSEMSQLRRRERLASASWRMPDCISALASFMAATPFAATTYSRCAETNSGLYTSNSGWPLPTGWPVALTCRRSTQPSNFGATL